MSDDGKKRPDISGHKRTGFKLPAGLVAHLKGQMIAQYGPRVLREALSQYDAGTMTAAELIEELRAALDVMEGVEEIVTGEKVPR